MVVPPANTPEDLANFCYRVNDRGRATQAAASNIQDATAAQPAFFADPPPPLLRGKPCDPDCLPPMTGDRELCIPNVVHLLLAINLMRPSNSNRCRIVQQNSLIPQAYRQALPEIILQLPRLGIRFVLPSGMFFNLYFQVIDRATSSDSSGKPISILSHVVPASREQFREFCHWLISTGSQACTPCLAEGRGRKEGSDQDAECASALITATMSSDVLRFVLPIDEVDETKKALKYMASRVTGNHIPRNMNRVLPSVDPAITFLDEALSQGLRTLGFAFRPHRYHPAQDTQGTPATEAELVALADRIAAAFEAVACTPLPPGTPSYQAIGLPPGKGKRQHSGTGVHPGGSSSSATDESPCVTPSVPHFHYPLPRVKLPNLNLDYNVPRLKDEDAEPMDETDPRPLTLIDATLQRWMDAAALSPEMAPMQTLHVNAFQLDLRGGPVQMELDMLDGDPMGATMPGQSNAQETEALNSILIEAEMDILLGIYLANELLGKDGYATAGSLVLHFPSAAKAATVAENAHRSEGKDVLRISPTCFWRAVSAIVRANDVAAFKSLLEHVPKVAEVLLVTQEDCAMPMLHWLLSWGRVEMIHILLQLDNVRVTDEYDEGVRLACWRMGQMELLPMFEAARFQERDTVVVAEEEEEEEEEPVWTTAADAHPAMERRCAILTLQATEAAAVAAMLVVDGVALEPRGGTVSGPGRQQLDRATVHVVWHPENADHDRAAGDLEGVQQLFWVTDGSDASCRLFRDVSAMMQPWRLGGHTTALLLGGSKDERGAVRALQDRVMALLVTPPIHVIFAAGGLGDQRLALRVQERLLSCHLTLRESSQLGEAGDRFSPEQLEVEEHEPLLHEQLATLANLEQPGAAREEHTRGPTAPTGPAAHPASVQQRQQDGAA